MALAALLSCVVTIRLGFWQLERLEPLREIEFRPVVLRGYWDFSRERALPNQFWERQLGVHLVAPLTLEDEDVAVLVDRGWVPAPAGTTTPSGKGGFPPR